jgi:hypothetical protein
LLASFSGGFDPPAPNLGDRIEQMLRQLRGGAILSRLIATASKSELYYRALLDGHGLAVSLGFGLWRFRRQ